MIPKPFQRERRLHREQRLSFRYELGPDEDIIAGQWMDTASSQNELSLEREFAEDIGVKLGDQLTLSILGLPLEVEVTSLREVEWRNARPNFFMLLSPKTLEEMPKEWVASVQVPEEQSRLLQTELSAAFTSLSVLDVSSVLKRVRDILGAALSAISALAASGIAVGLVVLLAVIMVSIYQYRQDAALLRILGVTRWQGWRLMCMELVVLLSAACIPALLASIAIMAWAVPAFMDASLVIPGSLLLGTAVLPLALALLLSWWIMAPSTKLEQPINCAWYNDAVFIAAGSSLVISAVKLLYSFLFHS